jgi:hypothetical protein
MVSIESNFTTYLLENLPFIFRVAFRLYSRQRLALIKIFFSTHIYILRYQHIYQPRKSMQESLFDTRFFAHLHPLIAIAFSSEVLFQHSSKKSIISGVDTTLAGCGKKLDPGGILTWKS